MPATPPLISLAGRLFRDRVTKHNYINAFVEQVGAAADTELK